MNEAVFREVNERITELAGALGLERRLELVCECGNAACAQQIEMTKDEYEALRSHPLYFAVYPGHEAPDVEAVVEKHDGYDVVRKSEGAPADLAEDTHPRT